MRRTYLLLFFCLILSLASCNKANDNIVTYTADEIYLNCVEYGYISGFPKELLIFESEEQLEYALKEYKYFDSLAELDSIREKYTLGEYVYLIQYMETDYDSKMVCKGLDIDREEMRIHLEHKDKNPRKEGPTAIKAYVTYAVLPEEYLSNYDFSNQQGVLYLGKILQEQ